MTRKDALDVIRALLIENGNSIDRDIIRLAFDHGISVGTIRSISRKLGAL